MCARCASLSSICTLRCIALTASGVHVEMRLCDFVARDNTLDVLPHTGLAAIIVRWSSAAGLLLLSYSSLGVLSQMPTPAYM